MITVKKKAFSFANVDVEEILNELQIKKFDYVKN